MNASSPSEVIRVGPIEIIFKLQASQTDGQLAMFEVRVPARARVPVPHSHIAYDETLYGLRGTLRWTVDGRPIDVGPGEILLIHRGVVHHFENIGPADAQQLCVITPGILGPEYFREIGEVVNLDGPPNRERIMAIMQRHGLRPVAPPSDHLV